MRHQAEKPPPDPPPGSATPERYAYPLQLAELVARRWRDVTSSHDGDTKRAEVPPLAAIEALLSVCFQASLLREEGRPITFRLALGEPEVFPAQGGPPHSLLRLLFTHARALDPHELRRLAPAAVFQRSLIGARLNGGRAMEIWGLIHSGPRWLQSIRGGRDVHQASPEVVVVSVTGPGRILVSRGAVALGELTNGALASTRLDVFQSRWLSEIFTEVWGAQWAGHIAARERSKSSRAALDPAFGAQLAEHVLRRVVATIRGARHGGTLIVVPADASGVRHVRLKYAFRDEEPRRRVLVLIAKVMNALSARPGSRRRGRTVGWADYEASISRQLAELDEAVFEAAHFLAALASVDGAVVLTRRLEVLGFGAEISGELPEDAPVVHALDLEGDRRNPAQTDRVGTRHRSAYRLCAAEPDVLAIVVSQDGGVRFVRKHHGVVTLWDQIATGPWEV